MKSKKQLQGKRVNKPSFGYLKNGNLPCDIRTMPKCQAVAKSTGKCCGNLAVKGKNVCYIHGGKSPGAPRGNQNALKHGFYTNEAKFERKKIRLLIKNTREIVDGMNSYQ